MRISDRYLGKQVLFGAIYAVLILSLVMVAGRLFREIHALLVDQGAPVELVIRLIINLLPFTLMYTIPWGFMTAVLLVFGRLSSNQEITGFRVAGLSLARLAVPVFVIGALLSVVCLYLNVSVVPHAKAAVNEILYEQTRRDPASMLEPGMARARLKGDKRLFVEASENHKKDEDRVLLGFHVYYLQGEGTKESPLQRTYLHATRAVPVVDKEKKQFRFRLKDALIESQKPDGSVQVWMGDQVEPLLMDYRNPGGDPSSGAMTNNEIREYLKGNPQIKKKRVMEFQTEITKRYSFSMACLAFAFVAVPLGLKSRRKDTSTGLVVSLLLGAAYFLFSVFSNEFKSELAATITLWLPNALCVLTGLLLFRAARFK